MTDGRSQGMLVNALSIDVEDWFQAELVRSRVREDRPERRVEWAIEPIMILLRRYDVRATFFVVGDTLRHHPELIRRIYDEGHEIGCHGWSHRPLWSLEPERFVWELEEFDRDAASVLPVEEVIGFRAPTFSLDERTRWSLDILRDRGYRYDSSVFPMRTSLYGIDDCPPHPYRPTSEALDRDHAPTGETDLIEFPMTVYRMAGFRIPISGGFYLRLMPLVILQYLLAKTNDQGYPFVIYVHPWEGDEYTPRVRGMSPLARFATYYNAGSAWVKLEALLKRFRFAPLRDVLGLQGQRRTTAKTISARDRSAIRRAVDMGSQGAM